MQTQIPPQVFFAHVEKVYQTWQKETNHQFDSIILVNGKATPGNEKTVAIVSWLFAAYNLTDTILCFKNNKMIIFASERKINFLAAIRDHANVTTLNVSFVQKADNNSDNFQNIWKQLHGDNQNPKIGILIKDLRTGQVAQEFQKFLEQKKFEQFEISHFFNEIFMIKSKEELQNMKKSSVVTSYFLSKFIKEIQLIIDQGNPVKHSELSEKMQKLLSNENQLKKCSLKISKNHSDLKINKEFIDIGPAINVQSGGTYSSQLFRDSNTQNLKYDSVLLGLGTLYKSYNSYVSRTLLINPTQDQKSVYKKILALFKIIQQNLRPGFIICNIYKKAAQFIKEHIPDVEIPKSFGFGTGIFLCEPTLQICEENARSIQPGHCFLVNCTFTNLKYQSKKGLKTFAVQLIDTVIVSDKGQEVATSQAPIVVSSISYQLGDDDQQQKQKKKNTNIIDYGNNDGRPVTRRGKKHQMTVQKLKNQKIRAQHQLQLKKKKLEELKQRVNQNFIGGFKKQKNIECWKLQTYKGREEFPKQMKKNQIYVDSKNNAILLPINGRHVPFNIHTLKNVVRNDQGKYASLRFNFHLPGTIPNLIFPKYNEPCVYVKEMVFRSEQVSRLLDLQKQIKALQKKVKLDISEKHAKEDITEQEAIRLNKGKRPVLRDLFARPGIGQKKNKGILECHLNGFRYTTIKGQTIDVTFSNIKYAFFQPCQKEIIAALHFRLHESILIGKKKSEDIQFYSQGGQNAEDIGGRGRFGGDQQDDEERQKQSRRKLDRQFMAWMKSCDEFKGKHFTFEIPDRDGGFYGNPYNNTCLLQPTKNCLINVVQNKFFIAPLDQIEVTCFQRMYANVRYFDMIFVMKDYENFMKISQIPIKEVEKVKDWLDSSGIIFYDQGKNLNWVKFLGLIRKDFKKFVNDEAWMAWDKADQEEEELDQDNDQSFSISESDIEESSQGSESSSDYEEEDGDDSDSEEEELSEQGLSSSQLQERAELEDRQKDRRQIQKQRQKTKVQSQPPKKKK